MVVPLPIFCVVTWKHIINMSKYNSQCVLHSRGATGSGELTQPIGHKIETG